MNMWDWITTTTSIEGVVNALGFAALAVLFATDRVMTKGQHSRRVADLTVYHAGVISEKDARYVELKESRDYYREARLEERTRADRVTDQLAEVAELAKVATQVLGSLDEVARGELRP